MNTNRLSVPMTLPAIPFAVCTSTMLSRGIQKLGAPLRSISIPSA